MVKARIGDLVILGLSRANLERLQRGDPILFDGAQVGLPGRISIIAGETEKDLTATILQIGRSRDGTQS